MTGASCIQQALQLLAVLDPGETPNTSEQAADLLVINNLLASWSLERLNIPVITVQQEALISGTASYAAPGTFATRPIHIENAGILLPNQGGTGFIRTPLRLVNQSDFQAIEEQTAAAVAPTVLYYDYQFPTGNLNLWPIPTFAAVTVLLQISYWQALEQFPDLVTDVAFAPGYDWAVVTAAALALVTQYSVPANVLQTLADSATQAKAALRAVNAAGPNPVPGSALNAVPAPQAAA